VARKLAFTLVSTHAPRAPSSRRNDEEDVDTADYGLLRGVWSPKAVLQLPLLYRYAAFLAEHGVCVPGDEAEASEAASPTAALAPAAHEADVEARGKAAPAHKAPEPDHSAAAAILDAAEAAAACEAAAAEEEELIDEIMRLSSELTNPTLTRPTLQLSLSLAARYGNDVLARTALALGADCAPRASRALRGDTILNERGLPPLHLAVQAGHTALVHTLLGASAPVTLISTAGLPPLHLAAQSDVSRGALELLLDAGAPIAMRDDRRQTALHSAARAGCLGALRRLIEAGVEYDGREERTSNRREPTIELRDRWHRTALHWAVVNQQHAAAALLISAGASVNGVPMSARKHGKNTSLPLETPLHSAARLPPNAAAPLVQLLLAAAADPNRRDQFGQTPLHVAAAASAQAPCGRCASGSDAIDQGADAAVVALLEAGAAAATKDDMDRSALDAARLSHTAAGRDELPLEISRLLT
jgi:ankyrin repeat protein